jgi:hypothetical protein
MESAIKSIRNTEAHKIYVAQGKCGHGLQRHLQPIGGRIISDGKNQWAILNRKFIAEMRCVKWLHERCGLGIVAACTRVEAIKAKREGRKPPNIAFISRPYGYAAPKNRKRDEPRWTRSAYFKRMKKYDQIMAKWYASRGSRRTNGAALEWLSPSSSPPATRDPTAAEPQ